MFSYKCIVTCINLLISLNEAARILAVFPTPSISHQVVFRPITQELVKRGHEVVVITTDPAFSKETAPINLTEVDVHDVSYKFINELHVLATGEKSNLRGQVNILFHIWLKIFEEQLKTNEVQKIIQYKSQQFDLLLIEACVRPALSLTHIFKIPTILVSSLGPAEMNNHILGTPTHPLLYPTFFNQKLYNLTLWEKIIQLYEYYIIEDVIRSHEVVEDIALKKYFPNIPSLSELGNNVDMLFLNTNPIWEGNRPVPPGIIYMGGLHQKPEQQLPEELKAYLDTSKNGVIYMSFGTNVQPSLISTEILQTFVNVFATLPYNVLWKFDKDEIPGLSKNVKLSKWLPQSDLLRHPNIKLFITQGGLQSTDEAITAGVPLIGIPMLADQWFNVEKYAYHKIGLRLDLETINEERLFNAINTVVEDKSFLRNVVRLRSLTHDQPQRPLDRAMWWMEHVLRHGGARHLRAPAANISWTQYLELDVVFTVLFVLSIAVLVLLLALYFVYNFIRNNIVSVKVKTS